MKNNYKLILSMGYTIDKEGKVFNPLGIELLGHVNRGYKYFTVRTKDNPTLKIKFHRLQSYIKFKSKIFTEGLEVRHLDGNSLNNSWDNIELGTHSQNIMDKPKEQRVLEASNPKYKHEDIINDNKNGMSYKDLMLKYDISSKGTISFIIKKSLKSSLSSGVQ